MEAIKKFKQIRYMKNTINEIEISMESTINRSNLEKEKINEDKIWAIIRIEEERKIRFKRIEETIGNYQIPLGKETSE